MKEMNSAEVYTKKMGGDYHLKLAHGDVFASIHASDGKCQAFYLKKSDLKKVSLTEIFSRLTLYMTEAEMQKSELKIIGMSSPTRIIEEFFTSKKIFNQKKVIKDGAVEVLFLPMQSKVRVSVEPEKKTPVRITSKFKVLIVDDSKTIRNILSRIFSSDSSFEVCAMAERPSEVEGLILKHKPDVITLDIHMPEMDGVALLKKIAPKYNIPTVMISSISMAEGPMVLEALENGAVDYIQKPEMSEIEKVTPLIIEKVKTAAMANLSKSSRNRNAVIEKTKQISDQSALIVLGSSTGGTEAIREILAGLPNQIPPMLIVQHIPAVFSAAFAKRMNDMCPFEVKEAENGDEVIPNRVLIAPGGQQMKLILKGNKPVVEINDDAPVNRFKPSVDYMFTSVAKNLFTHTVAVILTGMGKDGAKGMLELKNKGVRTIAQDEFSSVVFGMPKEAIAIGAAEFVEPLHNIAEKITVLTREKSGKKASA